MRHESKTSSSSARTTSGVACCRAGGIAFVLFPEIVFRLLVPGSPDRPGGGLRQPEPPRRKKKIEAPRGDIVDTNNVVPCQTKVAAVVQIVPTRSRRGRARGRRRLPQAARGGRAQRLHARPATTRRGAAARRRPQGRKTDKKRERPARRRKQARPEVRDLADPVDRPAERLDRRALQAHRAAPPSWRSHPRDPQADHPRDRRRALLQRHEPHRRGARRVQLHAGDRRATPGRRRPRGALPAPLPAGARRAALRQRLRDRPRRQGASADDPRYTWHRPGHAHRPERARAGHTTSTCAAPTAPRGRGRRVRRRARPAAHRLGDRAQAGPAAQAHARLQPADGGRRGADRRRSAAHPYGARAGAYVAMDPATARPRHGLDARLRRERVRAALQREDVGLPDVEGRRRAAAQPRDRLGLSDRLDVQADHGAGGAGRPG